MARTLSLEEVCESISADHNNEGECRAGAFYIPHTVAEELVSRERDQEQVILDMMNYVESTYRAGL